MYNRILRWNRIFAVLVAMASCAACGSVHSEERFIEGIESEGNAHQTLVRGILADGVVTRAETEQAMEGLARCLVDNGLAVRYAYDLDEYPWVLIEKGIARDSPDFIDYIRDPHSEEGKAIMKRHDAAFARAEKACSVYDEIEERVMAEVDWARLAPKRFDGTKQCLASLPMADRIDPNLPRTEEGLAELGDTYSPENMQNLSKEDRVAIVDCLNYGSAQVRTAGTFPPGLDAEEGAS